ncbi:hypothetical protein [Priestia megaterium]|uniref:hypothetical protein n=1 Tax=Priestia megaterium TaxID=1404 RepID=UPI002877BE0B|nr:hypothetical protein [Priestia megaterium]
MNLTKEEIEKMNNTPLWKMANQLDDGLIHMGTLDENMSVLEFVKHYLHGGEKQMILNVDGYEFSKDQSWSLINNILSNTEVKEQIKVQEYLENYRVEEMSDVVILRNPDFYGIHFSVQKNI